MPRGVPKSGKRKRTRVNKENYSSHYVIKVGLKSLLKNHPSLVPVIEERAKGITRAAIRISRLLNSFVLKCLESRVNIPEVNQGFIQRICSVLFGRNSVDRTKNVERINATINMNDEIEKLRKIYNGYSDSFNYVAKSLATNLSNMFQFTLEQRLKRYLRLRMEELIDPSLKIPKSEQRRVIDYIIRKLIFTAEVYDFQKLPPKELIYLIPQLIKEVNDVVGTKEPMSEDYIEKNPNQILKLYWHIQKYLISKDRKSYTLLPHCHFRCRCIEIGTKEFKKLLDKIQKGQVFSYNLDCLNVGSRQLQIDSVRTDGIQASVVVRHQLIDNHVNHKVKKKKSEEKAPKKKKVDPKPPIPQSEYLVGIDPGIVTLLSCVDNDGNKWELSNKTYHHLSHHSKNKKRLLKFQKQWNEKSGKNVDQLHNSIKTSNVSSNDLYLEHIDSVLEVEEDLLDFYCSSKVKKLNWDSYMMRDKTLSGVMNDLKKKSKGRSMLIGMGNGGFKNSYKGNMVSPKVKLLKRMTEHFQVHMVDEYKTSQICNGCHCQLKPVKHKRIDKNGTLNVSVVRGVKQCATTKCLVTHNRDINAAKNMLHLLRTEMDGQSRPDAFKRKKKVAKELIKMVEHLQGSLHQAAM